MSIITNKKSFTPATPLVTVDRKNLPAYLRRCDERTRSWLGNSAFDAAPYSYCLVPDEDGGIQCVLVGVRSAEDPTSLAHLPLQLPTGRYELAQRSPVTISPERTVISWGLGAYQFTRYVTEKRPAAELQLAPSDIAHDAINQRDAIYLVRDLVNTPTEDLGPEELAIAVRSQAEDLGGLFHEWVGEELIKHRFPAIHAVGRASSQAPRLLEVKWGKAKHPRVALIGKGVCFDTGGVDLKSADGMRLMKKDMGGAAHALALARLIMQAQLPVQLHLLIPAVENAVSGNAYRPGDVIRTRRGLSVEIGNTDAEGRVILCDALAYAAEQQPELIIDFATLTGAARVALGPDLPALFTNRDALASNVQKIGEKLGDPLWHMPLWRPYRRLIESEVADFCNSGKNSFAGSITAALFLDYFVPESIPWCHVDLFAWNDKTRPGRPEGGEAQSLRTFFTLLKENRLWQV